MIMIKKFQQGMDNDRELFGLVGPWATSRDISKTLGGPIYSDWGDIWHVFIDDIGNALGFSVTHPLKSDAAHIRFLFAVNNTGKVQEALLKETLSFLREAEIERVYTYDRKDGIWAKAGFTKHKKPRSSFYKWEKTFKEAKAK
jgi:hypothetical protein